MKKIVICGPESTGKTTLSERLANHYSCPWVPEYSRDYIAGLNRAYGYDDLEHIALRQMVQDCEHDGHDRCPYIFFDTHLIITQVWFEEVYGKAPPWLINFIQLCGYDYFLLCAPDLPWEADGIRENPGFRREELFLRYQVLIKSYGFTSSIIRGTGDKRFYQALEVLQTSI